MNKESLRSALVMAKVDPRDYSLDGGLPNDAFCLDTWPEGRWTVYYSERGSRFEVRVFDDESAACRHLLHLLQDEPSIPFIAQPKAEANEALSNRPQFPGRIAGPY